MTGWRHVQPVPHARTCSRGRSDIRSGGGGGGFDPAKDLYPKSLALVVRAEGKGRIVDLMRWGFPPPPSARAPVTNVRNLTSPFWRTALCRPERRCLVPVTAFCEWEGPAGAKTKRWFSVPSRPVFAFAGVWRPTEEGTAYSFLTCEPNELVRPVHPKAMPVILQDEAYETWLTGSMEEAVNLATPFPSQLMRME
ncbi:SOS response-associated peptidase [Sphingomonas changnyeongensis]|uniref:SOS response-associated peptidase n=1 Tax=Sphingomonas changnyeongensis TaxID=2698679 RepID=UPI002E183F68